MENNTEERKISVTVNVPWKIMWTVGFLFTLGLYLASGELAPVSELGIVRQVFFFVLMYATWPMFLGAGFAGQ